MHLDKQIQLWIDASTEILVKREPKTRVFETHPSNHNKPKKMIRTLSIAAVSLMLSTGSSFAFVVTTGNLSGQTALPLGNAAGAGLGTDGVTAPPGAGYWAVGYFKTLTDTVIGNTSTVADAAALAADFALFGTGGTFSTGGIAVAGIFGGNPSQNIPNGSDFIDKNIYLIATDADDLASVAMGDSLLVVKSTTKTFIEDTVPGLGDTLNLFDDKAAGTLANVLGADGNVSTSVADLPGTLGVAVVPEPSAFALFGLGLGALALRRRRA